MSYRIVEHFFDPPRLGRVLEEKKTYKKAFKNAYKYTKQHDYVVIINEFDRIMTVLTRKRAR